MSILAKPTEAPAPRSEATKKIATLYAAIITVMLVAQLFSFDEFLALVQNMNLPISMATAYIYVSVLVVAELFAIPFLLRMTLSKAFRVLSMVCGWLVAALWIDLSLWVVLTQPDVDTVGFLGTVVALTPGWWAVSLSVGFGILAIWSSWGLWPGKPKATRKK